MTAPDPPPASSSVRGRWGGGAAGDVTPWVVWVVVEAYARDGAWGGTALALWPGGPPPDVATAAAAARIRYLSDLETDP